MGALIPTETIEVCVDATGNFIPPLLIFPWVRMKMKLTDGTKSPSVNPYNKNVQKYICFYPLLVQMFQTMNLITYQSIT